MVSPLRPDLRVPIRSAPEFTVSFLLRSGFGNGEGPIYQGLAME